MLALAASALISVAVGWFAGIEAGLGLFSVFTLTLLASEARRLRQLSYWLEHGEAPEPPRARGAWDRLHALLHRSRRESARREAELVDMLKRWREAARALPDGVVILDEDRIAWCNDTARLHLEIDPVRDAGMPITHLVRIPEFLEYLESSEYSKPIQVIAPHSVDRVLSMQVVTYGEPAARALAGRHAASPAGAHAPRVRGQRLP